MRLNETRFEHAFDGVPEPTGEQLVTGERTIDFVAAWEHCIHVEKEDYDEYIRSLLDAGFVPYFVQNEPLGNRNNYNMILRKDERYLTVAFWKSMRKMDITVWKVQKKYLTDGEALFADIPLTNVERKTGPERPMDYGDNNFVRTVKNAEKRDFKAFTRALRHNGFRFISENVLGNYKKVYQANFLKGKKVVSVTYLEAPKRFYIAAGEETVLSPHLQKTREKFPSGAKNSLHMVEMWYFGNSFVIRLKNGHFLISDGGTPCEVPYLLDYLESLTPAGEKPVIEGWFITHAHGDHIGVLTALSQDAAQCERIRVDGIYYNEPNLAVCSISATTRSLIDFMKACPEVLKGQDGCPTKLYRPRMGERYYFGDITLDILMAQEQLPYEQYSGDFNDSGTWYMATIDGQKVLFGGDGDKGGQGVLMEAYDRTYMRFDVATLLHHGYNSRVAFTDFLTVQTMLFTCIGEGPLLNPGRNEYLKTKVKEYFPWGNGTRVLTFPYRLGESVCLPHFDWKYNEGEERKMQPNMTRRKW